MRFLLKLLLIMACGVVSPVVVLGETPAPEAAKSLPEKIGAFRAQGPVSNPGFGTAEADGPQGAGHPSASRVYTSVSGATFLIYLTKTSKDSIAYSLLTRARVDDQEIRIGKVGTAGIVQAHEIVFFKGDSFVRITQSESKQFDSVELNNLAHDLAEQLSGGENDIPVLIKHLPDWEKAQPQASYAVSLAGLRSLLPNRSVIESISFDGGAEAVMAQYNSGKLVIVEFNTARLAGDNDWNIRTRINQLRSENQQGSSPLPTAYRRVGNYSVFVFDSPSEQAANQLIDQVKYQQVVQWLGENPYLYENAQREFIQTTLGVFVAVVKGSGLALVACFATGGLFGALLFFRRRAQQRSAEAYSDAGGMVRLNLDEITPRVDPGRLLGRGN